MMPVLSAILPIVVILVLGKIVASRNILTDEGWRGLESATYYVLFPALIVNKLAAADFTSVDWRMPGALIGAQLVMAILSVVLGKGLNQPGDRLGVLVQSGVRWNTFIALAIAQNLMGPTGLALVAAAAAAMIPTANGLSILALTGLSNSSMNVVSLLRQVFLNPLIIACAIGLGLNQSGLVLPQIAFDVFDILSQATIAIGLLATGAHIRLSGQNMSVGTVIGWSVFRLLGLPIVAGAIALTLAVPPLIFLVILIATAVPTASNGAILARQLNGDVQLAANLIAFQTIFALASVTAILWFADMINL
ncbi:MAG: AEC family transporter [Pseudomonadota bacterium]